MYLVFKKFFIEILIQRSHLLGIFYSCIMFLNITIRFFQYFKLEIKIIYYLFKILYLNINVN